MLKAMFGVVVACLLGTPAALLRPQNGRKAPPKGLAAEVVAPVPPIGGRSLPWLFEQAIKVGRRRNAVLDVVAPPPLGGRSLPSLLGKRPEIPIVARADAIATDRPEALAAPRPPSVLGRLGAPGKNNVLAFPGAEALARRQRAKISAAALAALLLADPDDCLDEDLRLTRGAVPRELSGTLYVNGPARLKVGTVGSSAHPLDGHGYVRSFRIQRDAAHDFDDPHVRQRVRLKGRFVKTWAFEVETFFGFNVFRGFFSLPFLPLRELGFAFNALAMWRKNVANTCVVEWPPGQLLALWEMGPPHALDAETLRTTKSWSHLEYLATSDCALSRLRPLLAHTKTWTDGDASTLVGLSALGSSYTFYEFGLDGALASSTEATMPFESSIVHDFAITEDYYVVQENPVVYTGDVGAALGAAPMLGNGSVVSDVAATSRVVLVPRPSGAADRTLVFDTGDHALAFHFANAYQDDDGSVVVVAASFDNYRMGSEYGFDPVEGTFAPAQLLEHDHEAGPFLFETRLDVAAGLERGEGTLTGLATRTLADGARTHRDFPSAHPAREGRKTRYAYCAASPHLADGDPFFPFHSVQKVDVAGGGPALSWAPERPGCFVGEPVFAPRPGGADEDDGWLLVLVHDVPNDATELAVLSARNLALVAELRSSGLLPLGLHGSWSPAP